jgi:putative hemolysin
MDLLLGTLLILFTGFYAGSETAVYRANWIRLRHWVGRNIPGARSALSLLEHRDMTVVVTLVGTSLCTVFATELYAHFFEAAFGPAFTAVAAAIVIILTLILGEYLPKAIAQSYPDRWLRLTALPLSVSRTVFSPAAFLLTGLARALARPAGDSGTTLALTRQDVLAAMARRDTTLGAGRTAPDAGAVSSARFVSSIANRLFRFSAMKVSEAQIPLGQVRAVSQDAGLSEVLAAIAAHGYSRIPVYQGDVANITGVIVAKDLLAAPAWRVRKIERVNAGTRAMEVLRRMQHHGEHLAVVEDDTHRVTGIVSLEDLVEELVGEIRSER